MKTARLGELEVSTIGLGCMGMSQAYGEADPAESERARFPSSAAVLSPEDLARQVKT